MANEINGPASRIMFNLNYLEIRIGLGKADAERHGGKIAALLK